MISKVPGLRYTKNVKPILAELDTYRLSDGDIIMGLNLAIIEYRKRFRRIPNSREYPMLFRANQFDVLFLIISMSDYRKLSEFICVGYMIDPQLLIGYTPFYIEIQDDGVHAKLIPEPTGREIRICPNCKRKFMQGTVADFVYNIGSNHFCGDKCRNEYVEKMLPGLGIVVPIE